MIANGALMAFLPLYGLTVGLNPGEVGLLFSVQAGTSFFSKPIMGRVSDRVGRQPLIMIGLLICAITFVCMPHVSIFAVMLLLSAGFGFGAAVVSSSSSAFFAGMQSDTHREVFIVRAEPGETNLEKLVSIQALVKEVIQGGEGDILSVPRFENEIAL